MTHRATGPRLCSTSTLTLALRQLGTQHCHRERPRAPDTSVQTLRRPRQLVGLRLTRSDSLLALRCSELRGAGCATRSARRVAELFTGFAATLHQRGVAPPRGSNLLLQSRVPALSRKVGRVQRFSVRVD